MKETKKRGTEIIKSALKNVKLQIWEKMEFRRVYETFVSLLRVIIRIVTYPIIWLDWLIERSREYVVNNSSEPKEPTAKQIRSKMIAATLDAILENKNSILGGRAINRVKAWAIVLLEIASFITTAIGMTIVASDISPAIAIIWALVIQGLAGSLSAIRGKWNNIILAVCLVFSITSDYVCYVNAVFPYDAYIESQYTTFKTSYDLARERALEVVGDSEISDEIIDVVYTNIDGTMNFLKENYNVGKLEDKEKELTAVKKALESTPATITKLIGYNTYVDPNTNQVNQVPEYSSPIENPEYTRLKSDRDELDAEVKKIDEIINSLSKIENDINNMKAEGDSNWKETIQNLMETLSGETGNEDELEEANNQFSAISTQVSQVEKQINDIIERYGINITPIAVHNLVEMRKGNTSYLILQSLVLPDFSELRDDVNGEEKSWADWIFDSAATLIDSEFVVNAVELKKEAAQKTKQVYEAFKDATAGLVDEDVELKELIYGDGTLADSDNSVIVPSSQTAYQNMEYKDALSKALLYLVYPEDGIIETYSRVVYACIADGLVLLIGFSMRRKRTAIYRIHSRKDLTNEEPRLISEAFYNLAARPINNDDATTYKVKTLLVHLEKFISYFEIAPFIHDANLNTSYSLVCRAENVKKVDEEFKELICLLQSLKYIKTLSVNQYNFFKEYKLNKAAIDSSKIVATLPNLNKKDEEYCYLMTEGFALYFYEKINDLYLHIETDVNKEEILKELKAKKKEDGTHEVSA